MPRPKKVNPEGCSVELSDDSPAPIEKVIQKAIDNAPVSIEDMPLNCLEDYARYNERARAMNKKLKICRYPAKPCPIELHPKERIVFARKDQPLNPLPVYKSDDVIDYKETLVPGQTYDIPIYIVDYLAAKGTPLWERYTNPDGTVDSRIVAKEPRFALRTVRQESA